MPQKLTVYNFEWIKDIYQFNEDFIKSYIEEKDEGCFLDADVQYIGNWHDLYNNLPFLPERIKSL